MTSSKKIKENGFNKIMSIKFMIFAFWFSILKEKKTIQEACKHKLKYNTQSGLIGVSHIRFFCRQIFKLPLFGKEKH